MWNSADVRKIHSARFLCFFQMFKRLRRNFNGSSNCSRNLAGVNCFTKTPKNTCICVVLSEGRFSGTQWERTRVPVFASILRTRSRGDSQPFLFVRVEAFYIKQYCLPRFAGSTMNRRQMAATTASEQSAGREVSARRFVGFCHIQFAPVRISLAPVLVLR